MVYGDVPFTASSIPAVYEKIKNEEPVFNPKPVISSNLKDLLLAILRKCPQSRISLQSIKVNRNISEYMKGYKKAINLFLDKKPFLELYLSQKSLFKIKY